VSVRCALLALLSQAPKYGLQLRQEFEAKTGEVWPLNVGQVYTTLQRLERDGCVEADTDGDEDSPQRRFRITAAGRDELTAWIAGPPELRPPPRDELLIKLLVATEVPGVDLAEVVQSHRRHLIEAMQEYTRMKADADPADVPFALVVDAELFRLEAAVRWLDAADVRLRSLAPRPAPPAPEPDPGASTGRRRRERRTAARGEARR
jgi:DNA-binding PadR family transcriptional regulator